MNLLRLITARQMGMVVAPVITISSQPQNRSADYYSGSALFSVTGSVTSGTLQYQWEESTDGGGTFTPLLGQNASTLLISGLTYPSKQNNQYRCQLTATGALPVTSNAAVLSYHDRTAAVSNWTSETTLVSGTNWKSACWSPELGIFVAVSNVGITNSVATSPDGIKWTEHATPTTNTWNSVCWSSALSLFVAVSSTGTGNRVMTSPDGITWTSRTSAADNNWNGVCWSPDKSLFVAVSTSGTGNRVMTSPDGINWTIRTSAADTSWQAVCWSPTANGTGLFVAVGLSGTRVMTSPDGITWTGRTAPSGVLTSVCWSPELGKFFATASTAAVVLSSPDGITWTSAATAGNNSANSICWSKELGFLCLTGSTGSKTQTSPDGVTWTARPYYQNSYRTVVWSKELGIFAVLGDYNGINTSRPVSGNFNELTIQGQPTSLDIDVSGNASSSTNITINSQNINLPASSINYQWEVSTDNGSTFSPIGGQTSSSLNLTSLIPADYSKLYRVKADATGTVLPTSLYSNNVALYPNPKGQVVSTWNVNGSPGYVPASDVCWAKELTKFVGVSPISASNQVYTSSDGITWASAASGVNAQWQAVCWSPTANGTGLFAAVGDTSPYIMTSPDGITWTSRTSPAAIPFNDICWSPELNLFVAVSTVANGIITSPDGITWTQRTATQGGNSISWSKELGIFCAVSSTTTGGNKVMTSSDGITWTQNTCPNGRWNSVDWSPSLGLFAAVSFQGSNRIMTSPDGINWTLRATPANNAWYRVTWSAELGMFAAVSNPNYSEANQAIVGSSRLMTSLDGINWVARPVASSYSSRSITWAKELGIFVITTVEGVVLTTNTYP